MDDAAVDGGSAAGKRRPWSYAERKDIEGGLLMGRSIAFIAEAMGRSHASVSQEVKRNRTADTKGFLRVARVNECARKPLCSRRDVCGRGCTSCDCRNCDEVDCSEVCGDYLPNPCPKLNRSPFCCNACIMASHASGCGYTRLVYRADLADRAARERASRAKSGTRLSSKQLAAIEEAAVDGLQKGQSPEAILANHPELGISLSTFYRLVHSGAIGVLTLDLPRAVSRKRTRRSRREEAFTLPKECLEGRLYSDWQALDEDGRKRTVQMDTVVGRQGADRQCLLTLHWVESHFQLYSLLERKASSAVVDAFDQIERAIGKQRFKELLGVLLTDRGAEFADAERIERSLEGGKRCSLYYCDPYKSQQKPDCERNHEVLRRVLPKGKTDFDALSARDVSLICSHVNSYPRPALHFLAPVDYAQGFMEDLLELYSVERIEPQDVFLNPMLAEHAILPGKKPGKKKGPDG